MSNIAHRIRAARKATGLSQEKLAERMKISRGACGHWERGKAAPSTGHLTKLASILNVRIEWLACGSGNMTRTLKVSEMTAAYGLNTDDPQAREVAERYYRLSKKKRQIILDLIREL